MSNAARNVLIAALAVASSAALGQLDPNSVRHYNRHWRDDGWRPLHGDYSPDIQIDGHRVHFNRDEEPFRSQGTVMVPFRALGAKLGAHTDRTADGLRVWIYYGRDRVEYDKGHRSYRYNEARVDLSAESEERHGVLFVPIQIYGEISRGRIRVR